MTLDEAHAALTRALAPLGIDVGIDTLAVWIDRRRHRREPLPQSALRGLADLCALLLADAETAHAEPL